MRIFFLLFFQLLGFCLFAQNASIQGTIMGGKEPLAFANIEIVELKHGDIADEFGQFLFENLAPGKYILKVSYVGYQPQERNISLQPNEKYEVKFELKSSQILEEVVVTGTMKPTTVSDSPIKIDVLSTKQLETYLPGAATSVVEGIQLINGVQEVVACGVCFTNSISINGLEGPYTAILIDGTPMYGNLASVYGLNGIPSMIVDRFEVIKGPSSTLYGSEAVAGVINVITKNPETQPLLSVDMMGTTHRELFSNVAIAPKIGKSSGYIGLNYAYVNDFEDINNDGFGDALSLDRYSIFSKWNIYRKSGKQFSLAAKYYYEDRRNGVEEYLTNRNYKQIRGSETIYGESIYTNRIELFGTYEFNTKPNLKLDFSLSDHQQDSYYGSDFYKADQQIAFANLLWNIENEKHDILIGATTRYNAYDDNTIATEEMTSEGELINNPDNQFIPGVFIQDEWDVNTNWTVLGGMRLDYFQEHGLIGAPRINIKFKPSEWTTFRTNFGTGFRTVHLFTEDHAFVTGQRTVEITEDLLPEQSYNISFNANHIFTAFGGSGSIDMDGYFTHFSNKIIPDYDTVGKIIYANSDGYARTIGLSTSISQSFRFPLTFNIGANIQQATQKEKNNEGNMETSDILFAPHWSGLFTANFVWKKAKTTIAYTSNITGQMALPEVFDVDVQGIVSTYPRPTNSKAFSLHNIQISRPINDSWSMYIGAQNIFNFVQTESPLIGYNDPSASVGFSPNFDTSYAYAPNHGREFYIGIRYNSKKK